MLTQLFVPELGNYEVAGQGYRPYGTVKKPTEEPLDASNLPKAIQRLAECAALCNLSTIKRKGLTEVDETKQVAYPAGSFPKDYNPSETTRRRLDIPIVETSPDDWEAIGDPTEAALQVFAWKLGLSKPHLISPVTKAAPLHYELLQEYAFDATLKRMSTIYMEKIAAQPTYWLFMKGAVESVMALCSNRLDANGNETKLEKGDEEFQKLILSQMDEIAAKGLVSVL